MSNQRRPPQPRVFQCPACPFRCRTYNRLDEHLYLNHQCSSCGYCFWNLHLHNCPVPPRQVGGGVLGPQNIDLGNFRETSSSQRGIIKTYTYLVPGRMVKITDLFDWCYDDISTILEKWLGAFISIKAQFTVHTTLVNPAKQEFITPSFNSPFYTISNPNFIKGVVFKAVGYIINSLNVLNDRGSGWSVHNLRALDIVLAKNPPLRGASGSCSKPRSLKNRYGLCNVDSPGDFCFMYSLMACLHANEVNHRKKTAWETYNRFISDYDWESLQFPVSPDRLDQFEATNHVSLNIFTHDKSSIYALRISETRFERHANLLYTYETNPPHYIAITDFSALLGAHTISKHYWCYYCLNRFRNEQRREAHVSECKGFGKLTIKFPKRVNENIPTYLQFTDIHKLMRMPWSMYGDIETLHEALSEEEILQLEGEGGKIKYRSKLTMLSFGLLLVGPDGFTKYIDYAGENALERFMYNALELAEFALNKITEDHGIPPLSEEEQRQYEAAEICPYCKKNFDADRLVRVRHHLHSAGSTRYGHFEGATCRECNLKLKYPHFITLTFHNGSNFDFKLVCQGLHYPFIKSVDIVPSNNQKFLSILINRKLRLQDSYTKLPASLANLVRIGRQNGIESFKYTCKEFENYQEHLPVLLNKQVLPYNHFDCLERLEETSLPPKECFYNVLTEKDVSDEDYEHAQRMYQLLRCTSLKDYLLFYQKLDIFLMCDCVENMRDRAISKYDLDPQHYISGASYSFACCLHKTQAKFEQLYSIDLLRLLQRSLRGGITLCNYRYEEANLKNFPHYDPTKKGKQILFLDFQSLYSYVMTENHPRHTFRELTDQDIERLSANNFQTLREFNDPNTGFILECDFHVPRELEDKFKMLPPGPERLRVTRSMLSEGQLNLIDSYSADLTSQFASERLMLTLYPKRKYVIHSEMLQYYISIGVQVTRLHRGYAFYQDNVVAPYITANVEDRARETDEVLRNVIKLVLNSNFGYSIRGIWNDVQVRVARSPVEAEKYLAHPRFSSLTQISDEVTLFSLRPGEVTMNLNYYFGWSVLEKSKLRLYRYWYGYLSSMFRERAVKLNYCDTDSFLITVELLDGESDIYHILKEYEHLCDFSNLPKTHPLYSEKNKGVSGLLKFELPTTEIHKFCGLSQKIYAILPFDQSQTKKKGKGITHVARAKMNFQDYVDCLFTQKLQRVQMTMIRSKDQQLYTITMNRVGLSALNLKVFYLDSLGLDSVPFGHSLAMQSNE